MSRTKVIDGGVWLRATHLLAAILLVGGIVAGPLVHLAAEASSAHAATCDAGVEDHGASPDDPAPAPAPDLHHDCPVCVTLAGAVAPALDPAPGSALAAGSPVAVPGPAFHDRIVSERTRARAPPKA
jgi:hypothetical protein